MNQIVYVIHISSCLFMTGLIWLIQLIHYPSYEYIQPSKFVDYQIFHTRTITYIVGPVMVLEIFSGMAILFEQKLSAQSSLNFIGLLLTWLATAFFSVPLHGKLSSGYNIDLIQQLITTNWIRTILWTVRSSLIIFYMAKL